MKNYRRELKIDIQALEYPLDTKSLYAGTAKINL
jgi:hypothetical protein